MRRFYRNRQNGETHSSQGGRDRAQEPDALGRGEMVGVAAGGRCFDYGNVSREARVQHGIKQDDALPALHSLSEAQHVGPSGDYLGIFGQPRVDGKALGHAAAHAVIAHQRIPEADDERGLHAICASAGATGSRTVKVLPLPGSLSTEMSPPCLVTMP